MSTLLDCAAAQVHDIAVGGVCCCLVTDSLCILPPRLQNSTHQPTSADAIYAKLIAQLVTASAECSTPLDVVTLVGDAGNSALLCKGAESDSNAAKQDGNVSKSTCNGNADASLLTAVWAAQTLKRSKKSKLGGGWAVKSLTDTAAGDGGWTLFEDRPGKPGWISETAGAAMEVSLSRWNAPWLAFGLRPLLFEVSYMMTYGDTAATWEVEYCNQHVASVDTRWEDKVSLVKVQAFHLPACRHMGLFGRVVVRHAADTPGKVKMSSFGLCAT